jgi:hypothetical protein
LVFSLFNAHQWQDLDAGLREVRRILIPLSTAFFVDVVAPGKAVHDSFLQAIGLLRDTAHVRNYRPEEWLRSLDRAGLCIESIVQRKLPVDFRDWVRRTRTSESNIAAIRSLQVAISNESQEFFRITEDGSFTLDTLTIYASTHRHSS